MTDIINEIESFGVVAEPDIDTGLLDVKGSTTNLWKVVQYLEERGYINDGNIGEETFGIFGFEKGKENNISRILVFFEGRNRGFLPIA